MKIICYVFLSTFFFFLSNANAQDTPSSKSRSEKIENMHARKWQFLLENSGMTSKEAERVKPVFVEYEKKVWTEHEKNRDFFKSAFLDKQNGNPDYELLNNHFAEIDLVQGKMFKAYHLKLKSILSPKTLFRYYHAERNFKQDLLREMGKRFKGGQRN